MIKSIISSILLAITPVFAQNVVVFNNATTQGGSSDGQVMVNKNWNGSYYDANQKGEYGLGVYVGNNNNTTNFLRAVHGGIYIGGQHKGTAYGTIVNALPGPNFEPYKQVPALYSALQGQSVNLSAQNNVKITLDKEVNVFDVNSSQLSGYKTLDFEGDGVVIFNVTGNLSDWSWSVNYDPAKILWNFEDATIVNINNRSFTGSLFAANATVTQSQEIKGTLYANNWVVQNSAAIREYSYPVPELGTIGLMTLGGLILWRRRR